MNEAVSVKCPSCQTRFPLSEAVLYSVRESLAKELKATVATREQEIATRQKALDEKEADLNKKTEQIRHEAERIADERIKEREAEIKSEAARKATKKHEAAVKQLQEELGEKRDALKQAQANELNLLKEKRQLQETKEALELEVQRTLDAERAKLREQAKAQSDEDNRLKIAEKEKVISDLQKRLEEAQRRAEQGSQQTQGEVLELDFERQLREAFPADQITEISKGIRGADISHEVRSKTGRACGTILYENKRTKNWSDGWVAKLKADMLEKKAAIGVIVTEALPPDTDSFCSKDEIWITDPKTAIPLAHALRFLLQEVAIARGHRNGAKEKMEILYEYLTGNEFRQRVSSVIDSFKTMHMDLQAEKRALTKHWCKREKHINSVIENMAGMVGDVQAISGNALKDIPALELDPGDEEEGCRLDEQADLKVVG
jgi:hypothetical protein